MLKTAGMSNRTGRKVAICRSSKGQSPEKINPVQPCTFLVPCKVIIGIEEPCSAHPDHGAS